MKKTLIILILVVMLASAGARVITVDKDKRLGVGVSVGYLFMRGEWVDHTFRGGLNFSAKVSFNLTSHLGIISLVQYSRPRQTDITKEKSWDNAFLRIWSVSGGVRYDIFTAREFIPFIEGTLGLYHNRFSGAVGEESRNMFGFEVRGGVEFFLMRKWSFTASFGFSRYFKRFERENLNIFGDGGSAIFYPARLSFSYYF